MANPPNSNYEIKGQELNLDINELHRTSIDVIDALINSNNLSFSYDVDSMKLMVGITVLKFLDSQTSGFERNAKLKEEGWDLDKDLNGKQMADLVFEHIEKHATSKMKAAWRQLLIEAILCTHPDFTLQMGDDEKTASKYKRSVFFLNTEFELIEKQRREEARFSLAKAGKPPQTPEEKEEYKANLQAKLKLIASTLDKEDITWENFAEKTRYKNGESLRKAADLDITELKVLAKPES